MTTNLKKIYGTGGLGKRNMRPTTNEQANIVIRLKMHKIRMDELVAAGMSRNEASAKAFDQLMAEGFRA